MPIMVTEPVALPSGALKRIHVNRLAIQQFHQDGQDRPAITVKYKGETYHCRGWVATGTVIGVQRLHKPMPGCHARVWLETRGGLTLFPTSDPLLEEK